MLKLISALLFLFTGRAAAQTGDYVIILHGLGRTDLSMLKIEQKLSAAGYQCINLDYSSRKYPIEDLADKTLDACLKEYCVDSTKRINFVTHSMGGIVVRYYLKNHQLGNLGRVVMLAPPNKGSRQADFYSHLWPVNYFLGPNLKKLRTDPHSFVNQLGRADYEVGVIAGENDARATAEETRLEGMKDFKTVNCGHTFIMDNDEVIGAVLNFFKVGKF